MNASVFALLTLNTVLACGLAAAGYVRRRTPGGAPFALMMTAVAIWSLTNAIQVTAGDPGIKLTLARSAYIWIVATVVSWWWCCVEYAGYALLAHRASLFTAVFPGLVTLAIVAVGPRTTLMWTSFAVAPGPGPVALPPGSWFILHSFWGFGLVLSGLALLARTMLRAPHVYRPQLIVLFVAISIPLIVNAATIQSQIIDTRGHDFTPVALLISSTVLGIGLLRFGLLDLAVGVVPIAHDLVVASMRDGIVILGPDGRVIGSNPASGSLLGRVAPPQVGSPITALLPGWVPGGTSELEVGERSSQRVIEISSAPIRRSRGHVVTLRDVTTSRLAERVLRESLQRVSHQAQHDHLTGLPNRRLLFEALHSQTGPFALMILDLDGFKAINDLHGHGTGDDVLSQLGRRLRAACRPEHVVARLGGDEFAVLMPGASQRSAELTAQAAINTLSLPMLADGHDVQLTASAGIAVSPQHGTRSDEIVRAADVAMYSAKRSTRRVAIYGDAEDVRSPDRVLLVQELKRALANDEILCHYQAQARQDGSIRGVEALVRWQHPERGLLRPASFLKAAKQGGLMRDLSDRVFDVALADLAEWLKAGRDWIVSINLDADDLGDTSLAFRVAVALERAKVRPDRLTVEITESAVFDTSTGARTLLDLRRQGVAVALDDFGTGYGPLAHLRQLPLDEIKLDRSFVSGLTRDRRDAALVAGQIRIGHDLGLTVIAEGVESEACAVRLLELQCDLLQGVHIGMPIPASDLLQPTARPS
ncbi:MAG: putative bifunctional diguanylate cyclase/phosphodiesterase [Vicinamibacterales bacterium]